MGVLAMLPMSGVVIFSYELSSVAAGMEEVAKVETKLKVSTRLVYPPVVVAVRKRTR